MKFEYVKRFFAIRINRPFGAYRFEVCIPNVFGFGFVRASKTAEYIKWTGGKETRTVPRFYFEFYAVSAFKRWITTPDYNPEVEEIGGKTIEAYARAMRGEKKCM